MPVKFIVLSKGTELFHFPMEKLVYIEAQGNYSEIVTLDGRRALVAMQLGQIEDALNSQIGDDCGIIRLGRGLIINCQYVYKIDIAKQTLYMSDCAGFWKELSASRTVLMQLKTLMESNEKD